MSCELLKQNRELIRDALELQFWLITDLFFVILAKWQIIKIYLKKKIIISWAVRKICNFSLYFVNIITLIT